MVAVLPSIGASTVLAFSSIAATQYRTANATSLKEPLSEDDSSWFGKYTLTKLLYLATVLKDNKKKSCFF